MAATFVALARGQDWSLPPDISTRTSSPPVLRPPEAADTNTTPPIRLASADMPAGTPAPTPPRASDSTSATDEAAPTAPSYAPVVIAPAPADETPVVVAPPPVNDAPAAAAPAPVDDTPSLRMPGPASTVITASSSTESNAAASTGSSPDANSSAAVSSGTTPPDSSTLTIASTTPVNGSTDVAATEGIPSPGEITAAAVTPRTPPTNLPDPSSTTPSQNATINLINLMVKRNLISQDDANGLIKQAQEEADLARAQTAATQATADRALTEEQKIASAPPPQAPAPASGGGDDEVRIAYVPDVVKQQITEQVTQNVLAQTHQEQLADTIAASQVPAWVKMFHVSGDVRVRYESDMFPSGNAVGNFTNFNAINTGAPFNLATTNPFLPQYDVDQDRDRFRLRARIGADIDLGQNFTAGLRLASGSDNNPVTENQTLGQANNGQGGNFSKYAVWIDRAFIRYDMFGQPNKDMTLTVGRFDNPFFSTSLIWADDIGFDGAVYKGKYEATKGVTPFLTAGAFPIFNTDLNFSSDEATKFKSEDKYLLAAQLGTHWDINDDFHLTAAGAFYDFENVQGQISDPILEQDAAGDIPGSTDDLRPSFAQNGNTYMALRNYEGAAAAGTNQQQYFGLASKFQVAAFTGQLDFSHFDPFHMSLTGEVIKNVAFDRNAIINSGPAVSPGPQNNTTSSNPNSFDGGDTGYLIHLDLGKVALEQAWDWNVRLSYRYVETDATIDAFNDSDFGATLLGTNLKGYTIGGNLALSPRVWAGLRWMSADNVSGPTYRNDLIQFDLNAKF